MNGMLEGFMAYLEKNGLVKFDLRNEDDSKYIESTNRLQKYVFLANRFGLGMHYEYDMYLYGIQSRALMSDYCAYAESHASPGGGMATAQIVIRLPESFRSEEFLDFVRGRDDEWLYMATTLIKRSKSITKRDNLIRNIEWTTHEVPIEYIAGVLDELQAAHMIELEP